MTDEELAGLYPGIDGLRRRAPEAGDRVEWRGRPGETRPGGELGTVIVADAGTVTVQFDSGAFGTSMVQKFSPLTAPDGTVLKDRGQTQPALGEMTPAAQEAADCLCYHDCAGAGRCSLSGEWHVHPGEPCPVHPDAPGDH